MIGADSSHFTVSGGEVFGPVIAPNHTTVDISGGSVGSFSIFGDGTCSLSGGRVSSASVDVDSTLNITGGEARLA